MTQKTTAGLSLQHTTFSKPPLHIPNAAGEPYKTELVEVRGLEQTIKWNFWHLPDDHRSPHNHPWENVECTILYGGYTEERYWLVGGKVKKEIRTYRTGEVNSFSDKIFHLVTHVDPGTVSRMVCGRTVKDNAWGYLDIVTGKYTKAEPDPNFIERLRANNRFLIPKK